MVCVCARAHVCVHAYMSMHAWKVTTKVSKSLNMVNLHINNNTPPPQIKSTNDTDENEELQWVGKLQLCITIYD